MNCSMRTFFGGLFEEAQSMLNFTFGGMFLRSSYSEAREILGNIAQNSFQGSEKEGPARKQVNTIQMEEMSELKNIVMNLTQRVDQLLNQNGNVLNTNSNAFCSDCQVDHGNKRCLMEVAQETVNYA